MPFDLDRRVAALGIARMADAVGNSFLILVLPLYIASGFVSGDALGLSETMVTGIVLALFGVVNSFSQPFAGRASDRLGRRKLFVVLGLILLGIANFTFSLVGSYLGLLLVRGLQGVGAALTITASVALVNELSVKGSRGENMGTYNSFRLVGFSAGPLAAGVVVENGPYHLPLLAAEITGFDAAFYIATVSAVASVILVSLFVRDPEETQATTERLALAIRSSNPGVALDPIFTLGLATLFMASAIALLAPIETHVNAHLNQGPVLFGIQFASFIGALALMQPVVGRASDRYGRRIFVIIGLILLIPTTLAQGLVVAPWQMIVARLAQGLSGAMVFAPALALAGDLTRKGQSGAQLSVLTMSFGLGLSVGQLASGFLIQFGYVTPFLFGALLAGVGAVLVYTQVQEAGAGSPVAAPSD